MLYALFRVIHLIGLLVMATSLIISNVGFSRTLNREDVTNLIRVDRTAHISLTVLLLAGITLWFWVGRPAAFYNGNPLFHLKLGLFVAYVLLIFPTTRFLMHNRKVDESALLEVPRHIRFALRTQLALLLVVPVLAYLMARGVGY